MRPQMTSHDVWLIEHFGAQRALNLFFPITAMFSCDMCVEFRVQFTFIAALFKRTKKIRCVVSSLMPVQVILSVSYEIAIRDRAGEFLAISMKKDVFLEVILWTWTVTTVLTHMRPSDFWITTVDNLMQSDPIRFFVTVATARKLTFSHFGLSPAAIGKQWLQQWNYQKPPVLEFLVFSVYPTVLHCEFSRF